MTLCFYAYLWQNVHAEFLGRHGIYQRASWATSWTNCQFRYNRGLGIFLDAVQGDPGVSNGVSFIGEWCPYVQLYVPIRTGSRRSAIVLLQAGITGVRYSIIHTTMHVHARM